MSQSQGPLTLDFSPGEPAYYQRFGFEPASNSRLENEYGVGDEFMVVVLTQKCLSGVNGVVRYGDEFQVFQ